MYSLIVYFVFLIIFLFVFMYQRTTLNIARIIDNLPRTEVQIILTPNWLGLMGWISWGMYIGCILIGFQFGWVMGIASFLFTHLLSAIIPIPSNFFYNMVERHLDQEIKNSKDYEKKEIFEAFRNRVKEIRKHYKVT